MTLTQQLEIAERFMAVGMPVALDITFHGEHTLEYGNTRTSDAERAMSDLLLIRKDPTLKEERHEDHSG